MRARYVIPFTRRIIIPDHWEIPFQAGVCRVREEAGIAVALEVVFTGQPVNLAPKLVQEPGGNSRLVNEDHNVEFIRVQLVDAMAFLSCYFDVALELDEVEAFYEAEAPEEDDKIDVKSFKSGKHVPDLPILFDLLTRAIFCAEKTPGPRFEATLVSSARHAMGEQRYIDSFRYFFLLIEALYGGGHFKTIALKGALKANGEFKGIVQQAFEQLKGFDFARINKLSELLSLKGGVNELIDHLVDQRGIYFHSNIRRKDAWRPERQQEAHALALFSALVAQGISQKAAGPMFAKEFAGMHLESANKVGAKTVYHISFDYREIGEIFLRSSQLVVDMPGTKPTPNIVIEVTKIFIKFFEENVPMGSLDHAVCVVQETGQKVFEMNFSMGGNDITPVSPE
ncbi:hypothetical protein ABQY37_11280 [Xanthomonas hortorum]|uniref:hypothetical protein n=1 Tax=Xanthomonas hortorum TaxID=56454 RepID=UPI0032E8570A